MEDKMNTEKYIASGILELYVMGALSEKENREVYEASIRYPEIKDEVEKIEEAISKLSGTLLPQDKMHVSFDTIRNKIGYNDDDSSKVVQLEENTKKINWTAYIGWAASAVLAAGMFYMYNQNQELSTNIQSVSIKNNVLEQQIADANTNLEKAAALIEILRDKDITPYNLAGQAIAPEAYAKVYLKEGETTLFIDAKGLPEPPPGKVYQVWSLKLNPLTPTSIGLLLDFANDDNKVFELSDMYEAEAFGITLEPEGGSASPTLEQLYALGTVGR